MSRKTHSGKQAWWLYDDDDEDDDDDDDDDDHDDDDDDDEDDDDDDDDDDTNLNPISNPNETFRGRWIENTNRKKWTSRSWYLYNLKGTLQQGIN